MSDDAPGVLVAVVGPSGVGKDSLIAYARARLSRERHVLFVRRVVTRPALAAAEDHDTLSAEAFLAARASGAFAVDWEAHGLRYGIPEEARRYVAGGGVAVVNGSRAALPAIRAAFGRVTVVHVSCRPDILAARLAARGRETGAEVRLRVERTKTLRFEEPGEAIRIDNSGDIASAGEALVDAIRGIAGG